MFEFFAVMGLVAAAATFLPRARPNPVLWILALVVLILFVGLRHKVGMDWNNYLLMIARASRGSWLESFNSAEPAYATLLWLAGNAGWGVYAANLVGATVMLAGIFRFARTTPLPWVALATAMPMLIVVVGMSANRQAMAIGVLMWLVAGWKDYSLVRRVLMVCLASLFHFSAIFFLMFVALGLKWNPLLKAVLAALMALAMLAFLQYSGGAEYYDRLYVSGQSEMTHSSGAIIHVMLNGVPALLLFTRRGLREKLFPTTLSVQMALLALALVPAALVFSAASGRMTLYLFPVSMYVFACLPTLFRNAAQRAALRTVIAGLMVTTLYVWLAYANSSKAHIPYENLLWIEPSQRHLCCS